MIKFFRAVRTEHKKLWCKRSVILSFIAVYVLSFILSGTGARLSEWSESFPAAASNTILTDVMYRSGPEVSGSDHIGYYTAVANSAAERLVEINSGIEFTSGRERYALERERASLLYSGNIARYRVQYGISDEASRAGQLMIFTVWLLMPLIAVFSVLYASDMFAGEFGRGTVRMMLCRPVTRIRQYFAKLFTALLYAALLTGGGLLCAYFPARKAFGDDFYRTYIGLLSGSVYQTSWLNHVYAAAVCCFASVTACVIMCAFIGNLTHSRTASAILPLSVLGFGLCFGPWIGAANSSLPALSLFCCIDLATPLCGVGNSSVLGFSEYAASLGLHVVLFLIGGYAAFRSDVS